MKRCPSCNSPTFDDSEICFTCLHSFDGAAMVIIPAGKLEWFRAQIDEMRGIYAEGDRSDWFDADDIAREVAEELGRLLPP